MRINSTEPAFTRRISLTCLAGLLAALTACGGNVGVVREAGDALSGAATSGTTSAATGAATSGTPTAAPGDTSGSTVQSSVSAVTSPGCSATLHCAP